MDRCRDCGIPVVVVPAGTVPPFVLRWALGDTAAAHLTAGGLVLCERCWMVLLAVREMTDDVDMDAFTFDHHELSDVADVFADILRHAERIY